MKECTMLETIRSLLGVPSCAIPLSVCKPAKAYLLDTAGIPLTGTAILFLIPYVMTEDVDNPDRNVSLYAVPKDYHGYCRQLAETILPILRASFPAYRFALFSDHSPIAEVNAAAKAGLGIVGQHGLLITPEFGSFAFIGEVITDASYETVTQQPIPAFPNEPPLCDGCGACMEACPRNCVLGSKNTCLSSLTQKKAELTDEEALAICEAKLAWGCDTCQLACPHNHRIISERKDTPLSYFQSERIPTVTTQLLLNMSDEEFSSRAYAWRGKKTILRNTDLLETHLKRRKT